ncbi:MAG: glycosyltransferase family 1 protein, partial [Bacteroidales bacterium]|nr:glycosyltransferase family 1 protein [Bacteroidales bacterium]
KRLVSGVDIWLNTPTRPLEASGTSGEKAEMNGVLNFSVLDGWWYEGYRFNEKAGWALTDKRTFSPEQQEQQDKLDAATIYSMLENEIIPMYFEQNSKGYSPKWIEYIKGSIGDIAPHFTMKRMIDDYISRFYDKEANRADKLMADNYKLAKDIVAWKERIASLWDGIKVFDVIASENTNTITGDKLNTRIIIDTNGIGRDLRVEAVFYRQEEGEEKLVETRQFDIVKEEGNVITYDLTEEINNAGVYRYAYRIYPYNPELPHRMDFAYTRWV